MVGCNRVGELVVDGLWVDGGRVRESVFGGRLDVGGR